ncbi:hypothetical protein VCRA2126O85_240022 [Vibrio crassostreae]|nr:hypothetical protein VCRA2128O106_220021 [Vibrio crassostreae]CAK2766677.1 hypothetical protein VCRA2128O100_240020 [Vibrio crassostreae]CAK2770517.1 hypothetical protein VCRA2125O83_220060 [Vibrio crassostreae]CAK2775958.1 hypothetical protein VCRA2127O91_240059 [Vibrio crassostreae]CAK2777413.1 hypothetical protein VCRA2126O85_240022 [Vibrio crassostreae]
MYIQEISEHDIPLLTREYETKSGTKKHVAVDTKNLKRENLTKVVLNMYDNREKRKRVNEMREYKSKLDKSTDENSNKIAKKVGNEISALGSDFQIKLNFVGYNKDWKGSDNNYFKFFKKGRGLIEAVNGGKSASARYDNKFDSSFYTNAKDRFKSFVSKNMDEDARGRHKNPDYYTAALVQSKDGARRSECAAALLIIKDSKFVVLIKVGNMEFGVVLPRCELASYTLDMREDDNIKWFSNHELDDMFDMDLESENAEDDYESLLEAV